MSDKKCLVCNNLIESSGDWKEFNSCKDCWETRRDEVMKKRFPLLGTFADAFLHTFPKGTKVKTNDAYFKRFGRRVIGESVEPGDYSENDRYTVVKWKHQEGNVIPEHQGAFVLMMTDDLELYIPN